MTRAHRSHATDPRGLHVGTIAHDGLLWDAYLEFDDDPRRPPSFRGRLRFDVAGATDSGASAQTTVIIIEDSYEEAVAKARAMDDRALQALLRSALPDTGA
jgi:hypothetical protein